MKKTTEIGPLAHKLYLILGTCTCKIILSLNSRREALKMWKRKLGSSGTYNKLIEVFERAGYKSYADNVVKVMSESLGEIEMSIGKYNVIVP